MEPALHVDAQYVSGGRASRDELDLDAHHGLHAIGFEQVGIRLHPGVLILQARRAQPRTTQARMPETSMQEGCERTASSFSLFFFVLKVACLPTCARQNAEIPPTRSRHAPWPSTKALC